MQRASLSGGEIEYSWVGTTSETVSPPVVFLHEGLGCAAMWGRFPHALCVATDRRGLVYSRFGYGHSTRLARPRTERFMHQEGLDVLPELLDHLGVRMPLLIGQSDGASIALIFASAHPSSVSGLILEAPHVFAEQLTIDAVRRVSTRFAEDAEFREKFGRYHADARAVVDQWSAAWLAPAFRSWTIESDLEGIACPVLLMQAEHDPYGSLDHADRIARALRGPVQRVIVPGSGHAPHRDCRARALHEMADFLSRVAIV